MKEKVNGVFQDAKSSYKNIDWGFFWVVLISLISPFIYKFLKIFFIGFAGIDTLADYQTESSFSNLLYETLSIFVVIPIYAFVNKNARDNVEKKEKFLISFAIGLGMSVVLFILISSAAVPFSMFLIGTGDQQILLFNIIGIGFAMMLINSLLIAFLVLKKNKRLLLFATMTTLMLHIGVDTILISPLIFGEPNFLRLSLSIVIAPLINMFILLYLVFLLNKNERKEWKEAFTSFSFKKWRSDLKIYKKASLFSGVETLYWNVMWFIGIMIPFIIMGNRIDPAITTGALLADSLFWVVLVIPLTAATYLQAESHSHNANRKEHQDKLKDGFVMSACVGLSWLILGPIIIIFLYPLILSSTGSETAVQYAQTLSWIMFGFYFCMLFTRMIYAYWVTTNQAFKNFASTFLATTTMWLPLFLVFILDPALITEPWLIALFYGLGLFFILLISVLQLIVENVEATTQKIKLPNWYRKLAYLEEGSGIEVSVESIDQMDLKFNFYTKDDLWNKNDDPLIMFPPPSENLLYGIDDINNWISR